ncbi:hypothetical protein PCANC_12171 [Puccinia coronata f. sp. avenae]|uniref:Uncharacterized protein n=1 Tax=Puccinia coronata f. sp. avenae TaxID=200324 RepID=A0A2N5VGG5_9BASI|nr:hypothetical protein PCANC_12171 [Puccinia coronata f. sp. avenae]
MKAHALNQLSRVDSDTLTSNDPPAKGLFAMKFMQNAMAAKERKAEEAKAELRQQLLKENHDSSGEKVQGNPGRLVFNPNVCRQVVGPTTAGNDTPTSNEDASTHPAPYQTTKTSGSHLRAPTEEESTPWLIALDSSAQGETASRIKDLHPNSAKSHNLAALVAEKAKLKAEKRKRKQTGEKELATEDARVDLDFSTFLGGTNEVGADALQNMEDEQGGGNGDHAVIRKDQIDSQGRTAFEQRELVKQAFADDGVVAQFQEEKRKQIERAAPKEVDVTLPGCGDWVIGQGSKKAKHSKKFVKKVAGVEPGQRKDAGFSNVIILEANSARHNQLKKLSKHQLKDLPLPFNNQHQLELSLNHSLGPKFNTRLNHRHLVHPDVLTKPGVVIQPAAGNVPMDQSPAQCTSQAGNIHVESRRRAGIVGLDQRVIATNRVPDPYAQDPAGSGARHPDTDGRPEILLDQRHDAPVPHQTPIPSCTQDSRQSVLSLAADVTPVLMVTPLKSINYCSLFSST